MSDPDVLIVVALKSAGAFVGSAISILFLWPKTRSEFIRRVLVSLGTGVIFAAPVRDWLGWARDAEGIMASACLAAMAGWGGVGALQRILGSWKPK